MENSLFFFLHYVQTRFTFESEMSSRVTIACPINAHLINRNSLHELNGFHRISHFVLNRSKGVYIDCHQMLLF
jgi:hypothetical protein